ncbi:MAG: polyprenyl synthetase family protein [Planctomycetota bacterium]
MPKTDSLRDELTAPASRVEAYMAAYIDRLGLPSNLDDAIRYALLAGGKRLRPILALHASTAVGGTWDDARVAGGAVEMIHAFSLVHDDLPALDDDDLRRGRPTLHKAHGEAMAILAGDALLSLCFQMIADESPDATTAGRLSCEVATGTTAMIAGQVYDTLGGFAPGLSDAQKLELIHRNKTGALIRASCRAGAIAGTKGAVSEAALGAITAYAEAIGLMFQIVDDLLDVEQSTEHLGKRASKDEDAGKLTYPVAMGVDRSRDAVAALLGDAHRASASLGDHAKPLEEIASYLAVRTK